MNCGRKLSRIRNEIDDALHEEDNNLKKCPVPFLLYYKAEIIRALFILSTLVLSYFWFFLIFGSFLFLVLSYFLVLCDFIL